MANILFIVYDYPPILSPESIQVQRRALTLANNGHNIFILTAHENPAFEFIDDSLIQKHENIEIIHTKKPLFEIFLNFLCKGIDLTDRKLWWKNRAIKKALSIVQTYDIETIYTHSTPLVDHLIGFQIKKKLPYLIWIVHLSDPWTSNPYKSYKFKWQYNLNKSFEKNVLMEADTITVTSNKTKKLFIDVFPFVKEKIYVLPHTFDEKLFISKKNENEKIIIIHTGNIYGLRSIKYLLHALLKFEEKEKFEFRFYGKIKPEEVKLILEYKLEKIVKTYKQIPYLESLKLISGADYLLLVDAPLNNSPFFPSKLADYIGADKQIVALTPKNSATVEELKNIQHLHLQASSDDEIQIKELLVKMHKQKKYKLLNRKHYNMNNYNLLKDVFEK